MSRDASRTGKRLRAVVCGSTFGQVYLRSFELGGSPFELGGILAQGSARSRTCAKRFGVPFYTRVDQLPDDIQLACVVVRSGAMGGHGTELAKTLMARRINILQEHPVHHDELADCLGYAQRHGVIYRVNSFYPWLASVRRFIAAGQRMLACRQPLFVDAACSVQVAYPLFDILGQILGGLRPWELRAPSQNHTQGAAFRALEGVIAGIPFTLRVQNQIDPSDPDNHLHLLHRITLGADGATLTLVDTHGPVIFQPALYIPPLLKDVFDMEQADMPQLDLASSAPLGPMASPTFREIFGTIWPDGVRAALCDLHAAIVHSQDPRQLGQYQLAVCRLWQETTSTLGYPELVQHPTTQPFSSGEIAEILHTDAVYEEPVMS